MAGAGEWPVLQAMLPDFTLKQVLDLGCGYGWHCRYAMENGASSVLGIDLSEKMLNQARKVNQLEGIEYQQCALEDYAYPAEMFDVVISSLTLHYIENLDGFVPENVAQTLRRGGEFIFSMEHPVFTAEGSQQWLRSEALCRQSSVAGYPLLSGRSPGFDLFRCSGCEIPSFADDDRAGAARE